MDDGIFPSNTDNVVLFAHKHKASDEPEKDVIFDHGNDGVDPNVGLLVATLNL